MISRPPITVSGNLCLVEDGAVMGDPANFWNRTADVSAALLCEAQHSMVCLIISVNGHLILVLTSEGRLGWFWKSELIDLSSGLRLDDPRHTRRRDEI